MGYYCEDPAKKMYEKQAPNADSEKLESSIIQPFSGHPLAPLEHLFQEHIDPQELSIYLEEIEINYISYLLRYPELPGQTVEHQIHYLRLLRKALGQVK
jgi:hypothetical protein